MSVHVYRPIGAVALAAVRPVGLYKILQSPILYGVWHTKGGSGGAACSAQWTCNSIAIVRAMQVGGGSERMIDSCTNTSK